MCYMPVYVQSAITTRRRPAVHGPNCIVGDRPWRIRLTDKWEYAEQKCLFRVSLYVTLTCTCVSVDCNNNVMRGTPTRPHNFCQRNVQLRIPNDD